MKIAQRGTPLRGVYIPDFDQISVKISVLGVIYPNRCTDGGKIWHEGVPSSMPNFTPIDATCRRGEKPQNRPLHQRFALRAMLPVTTQ